MWLGFQLQLISFKPCYKWNTFNTEFNKSVLDVMIEVLNLVINGIPSILEDFDEIAAFLKKGFKPYYNRNTFNTVRYGDGCSR